MARRHAVPAPVRGGRRPRWPAVLAVLAVAVSTGVGVRLVAEGSEPTRQLLTPSQTPVSVDDGATPVSGLDGGPASSPSPTTSQVVVPARGDGALTAIDVPAGTVPAGEGRRVTYSVEVEGGLGVDSSDFAATVAGVLADARSWQQVDGVSLVPVPAAEVEAGAPVDIRVTLASPGLTDELCAPLRTEGEVSCWNGQRAVLNVKRWVLGAATYGADVVSYRSYVVNHEVGHGLGHGHVTCPGPGQPAPVMVQQSLDLLGCTPWPWPSPP